MAAKFISSSNLQLAISRGFNKDPAEIPPAQLSFPQRGRKVAIFSRQLCSMLTGGVHLVRSLEVLAEQSEDEVFSYVISDISRKLGTGYSFSKACGRFPQVFPAVFVQLLATGETTGQLVAVVERLADLLENEEDMLKQVRGALSYPIFIAGLSAVLTLGLFSTVLPGFADFYKDFDVELPAITSFLMALTRVVRSPWTWVLAVPLTYLAIRFVQTSWANPERRLFMYQGLVGIPLTGPILKLSCLARYCWVMELTQEAGVDLMRSLRLAALASGSAILAMDHTRLVRGITDGDQLSLLMELKPEYYPTLLTQMVMMGEETSRFADAFHRSATWFEQDVETRIETFQAALEPIMMMGIAGLVGGIILAVFLPLYGLLDKLG